MKKALLLLMALPVFLFSQTGKIGIGEENPQETLHVRGTLRLENSSVGEGKIIQVFDGGAMKWSTIIPKIATGYFDGSGYENIPNDVFLNGQITVGPGRWLVKVSMLIPAKNIPAYLNTTDVTMQVTTYFSESNSNSTKTTDYIANTAQAISGTIIAPSIYGLVEGTAMLNNNSTSSKTYYLWGKAVKKSVTSNTSSTDYDFNNIGGPWGENRIYAYPIETVN